MIKRFINNYTLSTYIHTTIYIKSIIRLYVENKEFLVIQSYLTNKCIDFTMHIAYNASKKLALYDYILFQMNEIYQ